MGKIVLSVIIVNYNGLKHLENCFDSLQQKLHGIDYEIIVTDNNSADSSCTIIRENYPEVKLIESKENLGFGKGNNLGVANANGKYLLLINNDTIVLDALLPVLDFIKNNAPVGVVGINMRNGTREYMTAAGNFPNVKNMFWLKYLLDKGPEFRSGIFSKDYYEVDWLGGSFLMMQKSIYDEIGGFDEDYFMYVEDVDFCRKIADKGYKRVFLPNYSYIHFVGFSTSKNPMLIQGYKIYISKHFKGFEKAMLLLALKINELVKNIKRLLKTA